MTWLGRELIDGAILFFSIALGIGAGAIVRLLVGPRDHGWRIAVVWSVGFAVTLASGAVMHAER